MNIWPSLIQAFGQTFRNDPMQKGLELKVGQLVHATLIDMLGDGTAVLQMKGQTVNAQLETQLPKGVTIPLVVMGTTENGLLELKISPYSPNPLTTENSGVKQSQTQAMGNEKGQTLLLEKLLQSLQLKDTPMNREIVSRLLAAEVSVTKNLVNTIQGLLNQIQRLLNQIQHENVDMQKLSSQGVLQSKQLDVDVPLDPKNISTGDNKNSAISNQPSSNQTSGSQSVSPQTSKIVDTLVQMSRKNIPLTLATYQSVEALWEGPALSKLLTDSDLSKSLHKLDISSKGPAVSSENANVPAQNRLAMTDVLVPLERLADLPVKERGAAIQSAVHLLGLSHENQLNLMQKTSGNPIIPETVKSMLLSEVQTTGNPVAEQALSNITGQQLMQSPRDDTSPFLYQYLSLPVTIEKETADAKIHFLTRKKDGKGLDPFNCFLYFQLQLPSLGEVGLHVQIVERVVSLRLIEETENKIPMDEGDLSVLRSGLQQVGYQLGAVRKETGNVKQKEPFSDLPIFISNGTLDYWV